MAEQVKKFACVWPYGDEVIRSWFSKVGNGVGRLKGLVSTTTTFIFFFFLLLLGALVWMDIPILRGTPFTKTPKIHHETLEYPFNCANSTNHSSVFNPKESSTKTCPDYFRYIHQDLKQWNSSGITRDMIERGKPMADFRLVIVNGTAYVERYQIAYQTRDVFTLWGIVQLLRLYSGKVPDLELLFFCGDPIVVKKRDYKGLFGSSLPPPPVFHYCGEKASLDIVFPDWTFWGWGEVNIKPWDETLRAIKEGEKKIKWENREPYAHWKGYPTSKDRSHLLKCNVSSKHDWNARLYKQDWAKEMAEGFKHSNLEDQCTHRYKIYIEGRTWSVSQKYILACDSMTLMIKPKFYDFFSRSLVPMKHYWPIRSRKKCKHLKFVVDWGNNNTREAQAIGKEGSKLVEELLAMENVYDYMFHLLNEYSKLLKFKPTIPPNAQRLCAETTEYGVWRDFMMQSMVKSPSDKPPCALPPPFEPREIQASLDTKEKLTRQAETLETEYWRQRKHHKKHWIF